VGTFGSTTYVVSFLCLDSMDIPKKKKIQKFKNSKKKKKYGVMIIMKKGGEKGSVRVYLRLFGL
jgi:hypothetical protein